jgi:hypothetical protein
VIIYFFSACSPCNYPTNYYSNKRWCCGDMYHIDMSYWSAQKLTDPKWGVFAINWRDVSCNTKPRIWAKTPSWMQVPQGQSAPWGWSKSQDRRPTK